MNIRMGVCLLQGLESDALSGASSLILQEPTQRETWGTAETTGTNSFIPHKFPAILVCQNKKVIIGVGDWQPSPENS